MNKTVYFIFLFIGLVLLQGFIFNNILFLDFINPYLYIAFIFLYPLRKERFLFLFLSFLLGLSIDFFSDFGGIHAFATLTIGYFRLFFVKVFFKKYATDYGFFTLHKESFGKVFNYVVTLTIIHHFILFSFANFSFQNIGHVFLNTICATVFTVILYFLAIFIFTKKQ